MNYMKKYVGFKSIKLAILAIPLTFFVGMKNSFADDTAAKIYVGTSTPKPLDLKNITSGIGGIKTQINPTQIKGNGTGYSGPDLAPVSIPTTLDHSISVDAAVDAMRTCYGARGYQKSNFLAPAFDAIYQVVSKDLTGSDAEVREACDYCTFKPDLFYKKRILVERIHYDAGRVESSLPNAGSVRGFGLNLYQIQPYPANPFRGLSLTLSGSDPETLASNENSAEQSFHVISDGFLPYLNYSEQVQDVHITKLGTRVEGKWYLKNLRVVSPKNPILQFKTEQGEPINLTIDTQQMTDCLNSALSYGK